VLGNTTNSRSNISNKANVADFAFVLLYFHIGYSVRTTSPTILDGIITLVKGHYKAKNAVKWKVVSEYASALTIGGEKCWVIRRTLEAIFQIKPTSQILHSSAYGNSHVLFDACQHINQHFFSIIAKILRMEGIISDDRG
jgi:hypothetical protein